MTTIGTRSHEMTWIPLWSSFARRRLFVNTRQKLLRTRKRTKQKESTLAHSLHDRAVASPFEPLLSSRCIARAQPLPSPQVLRRHSASSAADFAASKRSSAMSPKAARSDVDVLRLNVGLASLVRMHALRDRVASLVGLHRASVSHSPFTTCKASAQMCSMDNSVISRIRVTA